MSLKPQTKLEKSTSEEFREVWQSLNHNQKRYVLARLDFPTKKEAAKAIDIEPNTVYRWGDEVEQAIDLLRNDISNAAIEIITQATAKAAIVKVDGLDSCDEKVRQAAATEILDRNLGRPVQRNELTGAEGGGINITFGWSDDTD